ncbi:hypothetical protein VPHD292_0070 [Vibrio phage D292]
MSRMNQFIKSTEHLQKYDQRATFCNARAYYRYTQIKAFKRYLCNFGCGACLLSRNNNPLDTTSLL